MPCPSDSVKWIVPEMEQVRRLLHFKCCGQVPSAFSRKSTSREYATSLFYLLLYFKKRHSSLNSLSCFLIGKSSRSDRTCGFPNYALFVGQFGQHCVRPRFQTRWHYAKSTFWNFFLMSFASVSELLASSGKNVGRAWLVASQRSCQLKAMSDFPMSSIRF